MKRSNNTRRFAPHFRSHGLVRFTLIFVLTASLASFAYLRVTEVYASAELYYYMNKNAEKERSDNCLNSRESIPMPAVSSDKLQRQVTQQLATDEIG